MDSFKILADNWFLVIAFACCIAFVTSVVIRYMNLPTDKQIANVKEWLKYAVIECEKELKSNTGAVKLRMCYDLAVKQFPWLAAYVKFEVFSGWVDEALVWMREQLEKNNAVAQYVESGSAVKA
jgi:hypothetical protein|nr:MAG TPA: holin [Caudoviricetes sp.]